MAALAYHSHELTSYTYLTAEELVEGLVVEMEGPVVGLRGRWRDRWRDRGADGGAGVERAWRGTEGLQVVGGAAACGGGMSACGGGMSALVQGT